MDMVATIFEYIQVCVVHMFLCEGVGENGGFGQMCIFFDIKREDST